MSAVSPPSSASKAARTPSFLIIGAMRSGTTTLANFLRRHPDVFMAVPKELHFFDFQFSNGIPWYLSHFDSAGTGRAIGEATPNYMYFPDAVSLIAESLPRVKLVAILRNPVERAHSHYWHNRSTGKEKLDFSEALEAEEERLQDPDPRARAAWSYTDRGYYLRQLRHVEQAFGRPQMLVLLFEDLRDDPDGIFRSLCEFLGIDQIETSAERGLLKNSFAMPRSRVLMRVAAHAPGRAKSVLRKFNTKSDVSYPPMAASDRARLNDAYQESNEALGHWLGRDLPGWP